MDSLVLDTIIGIVFVFATFALLISLVTELISRFMGLRGEYLMRGLRSLLDSDPEFQLRIRDILPLLRTPAERKAIEQAASGAADGAKLAVLESAVTEKAAERAAAEGKLQAAGTDENRGAAARSAANHQGALDQLSAREEATANKQKELQSVVDAAQGERAKANATRVADSYQKALTKSVAAGRGNVPVITKILSQTYVKMSGSQAVLAANAGDAVLSNKDRRALPSYLSSRSFATAVIDLFVPAEDGSIADSALEKIKEMPEGPLKDYLKAIMPTIGHDIEKLRTGLTDWYDDHMQRVSGWYKRHVRWISLVIGALMVLLFNVNAVSIAHSLYTDQALRESVVTQAVAASSCDNEAPDVCLDKVQQKINDSLDAGLPAGWRLVPSCADPTVAATKACDIWGQYGLSDPDNGPGFDIGVLLLVLLGWSVMVLALVPGARFWFDLLGRLGSLRSTGPKPAGT